MIFPVVSFEGALAAAVRDDAVYVLTKSGKFRLPVTPPPLRNHGHYIISLNTFVRWLAQQVEAAGVDVFTNFRPRIATVTLEEVADAARAILMESNRTVGWFDPLPVSDVA